jgi:hypothetical protein
MRRLATLFKDEQHCTVKQKAGECSTCITVIGCAIICRHYFCDLYFQQFYVANNNIKKE